MRPLQLRPRAVLDPHRAVRLPTWARIAINVAAIVAVIALARSVATALGW